MAAFEWITRQQLLERVLSAPIAAQAAALAIGLAVSALSLAWLAGGASPATSEAYIQNFHQPEHPLSLRPAAGRILAGAATLGSGGALGFEGPSLYIGALIGSTIQSRWSRSFGRDDRKILMVAGAAAGVAAIFKAPATGVVFALEVPYRDDTARRMLLPALVGAATGYLTFVALLGTEPLFDIGGTPPFDLRELGGAILLGLVCGLGARGFATLVGVAKQWSTLGHPAVRVLLSSAALVALLLGSSEVYGTGLATGSGYRALAWVAEPGHSLGLIVALLAFRLAATTATLAGGGVGGLFVPLVVAGALVGDATAVALDDPSTLFPLIGVAAFLGAGYRTPLAGVMFVAETTGRPGFVVPGLIASVAAQLVMGEASVSSYQSAGRTGHLERRFGLPLSAAIDADVRTVPSDATVDELYHVHLVLNRSTVVPIVDGNDYVGMASIHDVQGVPPERWRDMTVADLAVDRAWPVGRLSWNLEQAIVAMDAAGVDMLPVAGSDGGFVGVVTMADIIQLDEVLGDGPRD